MRDADIGVGADLIDDGLGATTQGAVVLTIVVEGEAQAQRKPYFRAVAANLVAPLADLGPLLGDLIGWDEDGVEDVAVASGAAEGRGRVSANPDGDMAAGGLGSEADGTRATDLIVVILEPMQWRHSWS